VVPKHQRPDTSPPALVMPPPLAPAPHPRYRMAYVAVSRGSYAAQIVTNDREKEGAALGHDLSYSSAHAPEMKPEQKQE